MSFRSDYYEALVWATLEGLYPGRVIYEPARDRDTCRLSCAHREQCDKPAFFNRLIYTIPDFVSENAHTTYYHVCYWDSRETSHAKFWRTTAELVDIKRFVPGTRSICVVFEASELNGTYAAEGWYPDFLACFRELFDGCVFFNHEFLARRLIEAEELAQGRAGTAFIYQNVFADAQHAQELLSSLRSSFRRPLQALNIDGATRQTLWDREINTCSTISTTLFPEQSGARLRNASLQIVLISFLIEDFTTMTELISRLSSWRVCIELESDIASVRRLARIPVDCRNDTYTFLAGTLTEEITGEVHCELSADICWFLDAWRTNILPLPSAAIINGLASTRTAFAASTQANESLETLWSVNPQSILDRALSLPPQELWEFYCEHPSDAEYNPVAEVLIEATGLGTYPLVRALNIRIPGLGASRNKLRALYTNKPGASDQIRELRFQLLSAIRDLVPHDTNTDRLSSAYLLRKANRIVGPQSAINPLEDYAVAALESLMTFPDVALNRGCCEVPTLASDIAHGSQAGKWRISLSVTCGEEIIPVFISAMKSPSDCAHKTREFTGHLALARHRWKRGTLCGSSIRRGIAILEGAYSEADKTAFHLAGFRVTDLANLESTFNALFTEPI